MTAPLEAKREAGVVLLYFLVYFGYLFLHLENEVQHWAGLVVAPFLLIYFTARRSKQGVSFGSVVESVGLSRSNWATGLLWAFLIGLLITALQLVLSRERDAIAAFLLTRRALYFLPLAFGVMCLMAGFTEEFFFRGILQSRLKNCLGSNFWAVLAASLLFGLYHLPYAYLNPRWPSHGDWHHALQLAMGQGVPAGIVLGTLYAKARNNLLACVVLHSMINMLPAAYMLAKPK